MAEFTIKLHQADPDDSTTIHDLYPVTKAEAVTFSDGEVLSEVRSCESGSIILSSIWTDTEGVYTQTFTTINSITDCTIVNIDIDPNATEAEREAFYMLDFGEGSQTTTDFTLVCEGDLNTIDIPLVYYCTIIKLALIDDGTAQNLQDQITTHEGNKSNPHTVTASQVGLGNVDNTSDVDKPLSSIAQAEFTNLKTIQTASGTATAIELSNVELIDGFAISFVIALNNSSSATTINDKSLYLPGTTTTPELTAGKAVTVWYNLSNDCFYIKDGTFYLTATIPITGWSGTAPYYVAVTVTGLTDSRPDINPIYSATLATALLEKSAWNKISYINCTENTMTVTCLDEIPTTAINVELVGG